MYLMKSILSLFLLVFISVAAYGQEIPVKANTIVITLADTSHLRETILKVLAEKDYTVKNTAKASSTIFTNAKTLKNCRVSLITDVKGSEVLLTGNIVVVGQGNMRIENKGAKGTPILAAWEEMDKVAKAFGGKLKYEIR
jgi:hypothetical protein